MLLRVVHQTSYHYADPVPLGHNQVCLTPRTFARQIVHSSVIVIQPRTPVRRIWTDAFGNEVTYFTLEEPHNDLVITLNAIVDVLAPCAPLATDTISWERARELIRAGADEDTLLASEFCYDSPYSYRSEDVKKYAAGSFTPGRPFYEAVWDLTGRINTDFKYDSTATTISTPTSETLKHRRGVCQDFAHLQIACLRACGLAARYVSGYLVTKPPPGKARLVGADASHAWVSVYFPGAGWIDFDPTNRRLAGLDHITLAWGRDYGDVSPIRGLYLGGGVGSLRVAVDVSPAVAGMA